MNRPERAADLPSRSELEHWIVAALADALEVETTAVSHDAPFTEMGIDSLKAFSLTGDLSEWTDLELPATLFWDYPDVNALVEFLGHELGIDP